MCRVVGDLRHAGCLSSAIVNDHIVDSHNGDIGTAADVGYG